MGAGAEAGAAVQRCVQAARRRQGGCDCAAMTQLMPSNTFNFRGQLKNIIYAAIED
jgi:hypothetical protein